jgi:hypothetical protein
MSETITALPDQLFSLLQQETFVILHTIDHETGAPTANAISWLYAPDDGTVRFALDQRSRLIANLEQTPLATLTLIGAGTVRAIYGKAERVSERLDNVPIKLACYDLKIDAVRSAMFYGARISVQPEFEKTYDKRAADKLDGQVYDAMKKA